MTRTVITGARYTPGPWVGMAAERMWLIGDLDPGDPVLGATWPLVSEGATVDAVLASLLAAQLRPPLNLAIARIDDNGTEVVVRGDATASVTFDSSSGRPPVELRAGQGEFRDIRLDGFAMVSLHVPAPGTDAGVSAVAEELRTGVVSALQMTILSDVPMDAAADVAPAQPVPARPFEAMFGRTIHPTDPVEQASAVPAEWMAGMRRPEEPVEVVSGPPPGATLPPPHTAAHPPATEEYRSQFEQPYVSAPPPSPSPPAPSPAPRFADVSWADISESPSPAPDPYASYHSAHPAPATYQPPPSLAPPPAPVHPAPYQAVPGHPAASPPYPSAPAPYAPYPPTAGAGGIDPELMATTQRAPSTPAVTGPVVGAVRCAVGHLNPPAAPRCRLCGGAVPPQTPQPVPRPPLGILRLSTGEVVTLDRGVILGRAPGAPEGFGRDEPYRIQLSSPDGSISRKHVEVLLQGWLVTVVDLQSTNGTQVVAPNGLPEQLPPGGRRQIENGWTVHLDANTWFRFEVTE